MQYTHHQLGHVAAGTLVQVSLKGTEANVRLLDDANYRAYHAGQAHQYAGGHYRQSPVVLQVPSTGTWHVVVDLGGYGGSVTSRARILARR